MRRAVDDVAQLDAAHHYHRDEADKEHQAAQQPEEVHRLDAKLGLEPERQQVEITIHKAVEAKLGGAVLAGLMMDHLLADACKAGILGQIGHIAVHIAVHLDMLDHIEAIGLQAAVEIMQVVDAAHPSCRGVE